MKHSNATAACILAALCAPFSMAHADDVHCPPALGPTTIDGNVLVTGPCRLDGTTVIGNVHLYTGGSLIARGAHIDGNIQGDVADFVDVDDSFVGGSIQLDEMVGDRIVIARTEVGGSIQLVKNRSAHELTGNDVGADIQAFENSGGIDIRDNVVDGNLQCKENAPRPTGQNNTVHGNKEDQCANLSPAASQAPAANGAQQDLAGSQSVGAAEAAGGGGALDLLTLAILSFGALATAVARAWRQNSIPTPARMVRSSLSAPGTGSDS